MTTSSGAGLEVPMMSPVSPVSPVAAHEIPLGGHGRVGRVGIEVQVRREVGAGRQARASPRARRQSAME